MASEITISSPTGGRKIVPHRDGLTLGEALALLGWSGAAGGWYRMDANNGSEQVQPSTVTESGQHFQLVPSTKGGAR